SFAQERGDRARADPDIRIEKARGVDLLEPCTRRAADDRWPVRWAYGLPPKVPPTECPLGAAKTAGRWAWGGEDSNLRPADYETMNAFSCRRRAWWHATRAFLPERAMVW